MKMASLKRDATFVKGILVKRGDRVVTTAPLSIYIPSRWRSRKMLYIGDSIKAVGLFMITSGGKYAVNSACTLIEIGNTTVAKEDVEGVEHFRFDYEAGDTVFPNTNTVVDGNNLFRIYDELFQKGKVPAWYHYNDLLDVFNTAQSLAGVKLSANHVAVHAIIAQLARTPSDLMALHRNTSTRTNYTNVKFISMKSPIFGANNNVTRTTGANFDDKLTAALIDDIDDPGTIEKYMRM